MVLRGGARRVLKAHAVTALIEHPTGWVLFDTGYAPRVLEAFGQWPYRIYGWLTPTFLGESVLEQLPHFGITAADISTVILSHLHADHVGGLLDFPKAKIILTKAAWSHARGKTGFAALRQGFIPLLLPPNFESRAELLGDFSGEPLPYLGPTHDLLGDGTLRLVALPGHARGQMGLLIDGKTLLAADGAWHSRAFREGIPPAPLPLKLLFDNEAATLKTLHGLGRFQQAHPEIRIIPTHCPEIAAEFFGATP